MSPWRPAHEVSRLRWSEVSRGTQGKLPSDIKTQLSRSLTISVPLALGSDRRSQCRRDAQAATKHPRATRRSHESRLQGGLSATLGHRRLLTPQTSSAPDWDEDFYEEYGCTILKLKTYQVGVKNEKFVRNAGLVCAPHSVQFFTILPQTMSVTRVTGPAMPGGTSRLQALSGDRTISGRDIVPVRVSRMRR